METNQLLNPAPEAFNLIGNVQHELFKAAVLRHLREGMGNEEWESLRLISKRPSDYRKYINVDIPPDILPERLVQVAVCECGITVNEALIPPYSKNALEIGIIDNMPVYYVQGCGIYLWGSGPDSAPILMLWATEPAYPPGW
jgi:hypothetical protein